MTTVRPADVCRALLRALEASDGRRKRRMRNTTPDALGQAIERDLLERATADDPDAGRFEGWLLEQVLTAGGAGAGGTRAMPLEIFSEWRLAAASSEFVTWLDAGAPSDNRASEVTT